MIEKFLVVKELSKAVQTKVNGIIQAELSLLKDRANSSFDKMFECKKRIIDKQMKIKKLHEQISTVASQIFDLGFTKQVVGEQTKIEYFDVHGEIPIKAKYSIYNIYAPNTTNPILTNVVDGDYNPLEVNSSLCSVDIKNVLLNFCTNNEMSLKKYEKQKDTLLDELTRLKKSVFVKKSTIQAVQDEYDACAKNIQKCTDNIKRANDLLPKLDDYLFEISQLLMQYNDSVVEQQMLEEKYKKAEEMLTTKITSKSGISVGIDTNSRVKMGELYYYFSPKKFDAIVKSCMTKRDFSDVSSNLYLMEKLSEEAPNVVDKPIVINDSKFCLLDENDITHRVAVVCQQECSQTKSDTSQFCDTLDIQTF